MTTVAAAQAAIRARAEANFTATPLRWKNETAPLPDEPAAFAYVELIVERSFFAGFGGGRGANLQRSEGRIEAQFLAPVGTGVETLMTAAETFCAVFRGQRTDDISYFSAEVFPASGRSDDGNYDHVATAIIDLHFDKIA